MAQWYRAFVTIPHTNGLPKDAVQNTFAFMVGGSADRDLVAGDIDSRLTSFYTNIGAYRSSQMDWSGSTVDVIDMTDDKPRLPFYTAPLTQTNPAGTANDMPAEVAVVLSVEGEKTSGVNMRRRRGRVYIGPLQISAADHALVETGLYTAISNAAATNLLNPTLPLGLCDWAIYSPYTHHGVPVGERFTNEDEWPEIPDALPASFTPAARCWVDNAFDTQRRRGVSATTRLITVAT
jgi:hypothetical protein